MWEGQSRMNAKIGIQIIGTVKRTVKEYRSSKNPIVRLGASLFHVLWNTVQTSKRLYSDTNFRSIFLLQLLNSENVHQTTSLTYMNRYPAIFSACREYLHGKQDLKILSYGCSTGEEVLTLRQYFPTAYIIGAEINKRSLEKCRNLHIDKKIKFIYSNQDEIQKHGPFDAVFCMAVLQRQPHHIKAKGITSLQKIYPFEKFERQVIELDKLVKPQGLLIIHYTQYSLLDTAIASKYDTLGEYNQNDYLSPVFDKHSNLIETPSPQNSIFFKS
jgi:hypothetical protein